MNLGNLEPVTSIGYSVFDSAGFHIEEPGRNHEVPEWFHNKEILKELYSKNLCGKTPAEKRKQSDIRICCLGRYFGEEQEDAKSIAQFLQSLGYKASAGGVEKLVQRLRKRGDDIARRLGIINEAKPPAQIATRTIVVDGENREIKVYEPRDAAEIESLDECQCDPRFQTSPSRDKSARKKKATGWTPEIKKIERAHAIGAFDIQEAYVNGNMAAREFIEAYGRMPFTVIPRTATNRPVRLSRDKRESAPLTSPCGVSRLADLAPTCPSGPYLLATKYDDLFVGGHMIQIFAGAGHQQKIERRDTSLGALEVVTGIRKWKLSAFECGYARLTADELERVNRSLNAIEAIQRLIAPAKLDCSDGVALKAAVDFYLSGGRFYDLQRFAAKPPELPLVVTY